MTGTWYPALVGQTIKAGTPYISMDHRGRLRAHDPVEEDYQISNSGYFPTHFFVPKRIPLLTDAVGVDRNNPFVGEINGVLGRFFMQESKYDPYTKSVYQITKDGAASEFCHESGVTSVVRMEVIPVVVEDEEVPDVEEEEDQEVGS